MSAAHGLANARTLALLLCAGCGGGNTLQGSLSQDVSLAFDSVQVQQSGNAVALVYLRAVPGGSGDDIVFKLTADTTGLDLTKALNIDLTQMDNGAERGECERLVSGDSRTSLPAIMRGSLDFSGAVQSGASVSGSFNILFVNDGQSDLGEGETVFGNFGATVMEAQ